eukprot:Skav223450  [mRNA]  locus=scaffold350:865004:869587:- [translate_table: standard]
MEAFSFRPTVHLNPRNSREGPPDESRVTLLPRSSSTTRRVVMGEEHDGRENREEASRVGPVGERVRLRSQSRCDRSRRARSTGPRFPKEEEVEGGCKGGSHGEEEQMGLERKQHRPQLPETKDKAEEKEGRVKLQSSSASKSQEVRSEESEGEDLYPEEHQAKYIARKCPGLLFRHGIKQAKSQVLALQGESSRSREPEPVFLRYHRQVFMSQSSSPPLRREHLTISTVVDHLVKGEVLKAVDILVQRMKALEQIAQGAPAHMSMKLEVIPADQVSMVSPEEARTAAAEHAKELKLQSTWKGKGKNTYNPSSSAWGAGAGKGKQEKGSKGKFNKGERQERGYRTYLDNFDRLVKTNPEAASLLEGTLDPVAGSLREEYSRWNIPINDKKSVCNARVAEVQGAIIDGQRGLVFPKMEKFGRYLKAGHYLLIQKKCSLKMIQVVLGGFNYLFSFRRPLMAIFNESWTFTSQFQGNPRQWLVIPPQVKEELFVALSLTPLCYMDLRLPYDPVVTVSDASEGGGGLCQSVGLTTFGRDCESKYLRGERPDDGDDKQLLVISLFDGIGCLRAALDVVGVKLSGYVSVEKDANARRTLESNFGNVEFYDDVVAIDVGVIRGLAAKFPRTSCVLVSGGPPCQGVSGLNASRLGLEDPRSGLHTHVRRVKELCKAEFGWCEVVSLMESVCSMDEQDRSTMTRHIGMLPFKIDALGLSLCRRPRWWWFDWSLEAEEGVNIFMPPSSEAKAWGTVTFEVPVSPEDYLPPGWKLAGGTEHKLPTFTTSIPKTKPGFKPAGLASCSQRDLDLWAEDRFKFPPYQYKFEHGLWHQRKGWQLPGVQHKEAILGLPIDYTYKCWTKQAIKGDPLGHEDARLSQLGNAWSVQVAAFLVKNLCEPRSLCPPLSLKEMLRRCQPGSNGADVPLNTYLLRPPWKPSRQALETSNSEVLVSRLGHLVSNKGGDLLLTADTEATPSYDRLRSTVPPHLWKWKVVCGWRWRYPAVGADQKPEHINKLELRAVLSSLKWRVQKQRLRKRRFLHLVDSQVCLMILNKGRSSARSLQHVMKKISCLLLLSGTVCLVGYVESSLNPADEPSRRGGQKRKWGSAQ